MEVTLKAWPCAESEHQPTLSLKSLLGPFKEPLKHSDTTSHVKETEKTITLKKTKPKEGLSTALPHSLANTLNGKLC